MTLFSFFHWSLKSEENSCQTQNKVLGEGSFSPDLAFTEKNTTVCPGLWSLAPLQWAQHYTPGPPAVRMSRVKPSAWPRVRLPPFMKFPKARTRPRTRFTVGLSCNA
ncbi:hypothetical protein EYF80_049990 [Liparis tanakae]|uniref:Uncharacterized protein n=1 Tax=Liparis tanakae TaxID=230148 RepID=A0A4Z2FFA2_9TELE|nr:hypothetical protein EYF80_049990 [Liparis tanakae]